MGVKGFPLDKSSVFLIFIVFSVLFGFGLVTAANCWEYNSVAAGCTSANGCLFRNDSWGSWCEELSCWSLSNQTSCNSISVSGQNCSWQSGGTFNYCGEPECWDYSGTNETHCETNPQGLSCDWTSSCYSTGGGGNCWGIGNEASCLNQTGCAWGDCRAKNCWNYNTSNSCSSALDPWNGRNCTWNSASSSCSETTCYTSGVSSNRTACEANSFCRWSGSNSSGSCQELGCWSFDGNQAGCLAANSTNDLDCLWEDGWCVPDRCWEYDGDQSACNARTDCSWKSWETSGWCEEVRCWSWDSSHGGSNASCVGNSSLYGINCVWVGNPAGNLTNGWCENDFSSTNCSSVTTEKECYDTFYCWWNANDWSNSALGGNCTDPDWASVGGSSNVKNDWNPGCYIFDNNATHCNATLGCQQVGNQCDEITSGNNSNYGTNITNNGIECNYINNSGLCNAMAALSTCCSWQNGSCSEARFSTTCWNSLDETPEGADSCEDATGKNNCNSLAGSPWYWPCKWDNSSTPAKCTVKSDDIWGNRTKSLVTIENRKVCEAIGGKWVTENYCEGNVSVATGRCEYKFDEEDNCDKACFACEQRTGSKSTGGAGQQITSANAKDSCTNSLLGYCEFKSDSSAPNGIGICKAKKEFKEGVSEECSASNCGGCTFKGDASKNNQNGTKTPESYCNQYSNSCEWVIDTSLTTNGHCVNKGEKRCETACDRCESQNKCVNDGRSDISNKTGGCKWQGTANDGSCVANVAGAVEICWNGEDDDSDGLIDCSDPGCYGDSFCGLVDGDCFVWATNATCVSNSCEWITDKWGSWCDFPGSQCWLNDGSQTSCLGMINRTETLNISTARLTSNNINVSKTFTLSRVEFGWNAGTVIITNSSGTTLAGNFTVNFTTNTITFANNTFMISGGGAGNITNVTYQYNATKGQHCEWMSGNGNGWCEQDWSVAEGCWDYNNETSCSGGGCSWTNDTWCDGAGAGSDWCDGTAGWCDHADFAHKDCWEKTNSTNCGSTTGCSWRTDEWSEESCNVDWSGDCWDYNNQTSCESNSCWWNTNWNSCTNKMEECWQATTAGACSSTSADCSWDSWSNSCQPSCYNSTNWNNENSCNAISGCNWREAGWCEEQQSAKCFASNVSSNSSACEVTSGCNWRESGWCNPKDGFSTGSIGGSGGGGESGECWKFDGNQASCQNTTDAFTCGWFAEPSPFCEPDWNNDCWQYASDGAGGCNATNNCWWNSVSSSCTNIKEQCWQNTTLVSNSTLCNANAHCNSTNYGCEPDCFATTSSGSCTNGCNWITGWCNGGGAHEVFDGIQGGEPTPIAVDSCPESGMKASVDICGVGMKDMGDAYGFGAKVVSMENSSICNKEKVGSSTFGGASDIVGSGTETVQLVVYLDTDGSKTGGCTIESNSSRVGYEFKLRYKSIWNASTSKAVETFASSKCDTNNNNWKATDIKTSTWKKIMCSDIGGPMIAIEKSELSRFPSLYNSSKDMRVFMVTSGNTGNVTYPIDKAGPGWITPGAVDFAISSAFEFGADGAKFEGILKKGYVEHEDCFNSVDDDDDGAVDCSDWDCQFNPKCSATGVNADGFEDTQMPKVTGIKIEEYTDSALILYDTNKPSNGSLLFYGTDNNCKTLNDTIEDIGALSSTVRDYKLWHVAEIYNDSANSLSYALTNNTAYYYKLKICDNNNKCAVSKCSSIVTAPTNKCGFCNFVTRIKAPSGWTVSYDTNQDGTYEHTQGAVCGPSAGMKSNYSMGRSVNIKMAKDDGTTYFEFINASLTKTALNDKVRSINTAGDLISTGALIGLTSSTRDKIINNLHPEVCRVKINSDSCTQLFHCDDSGNNCVDRTDEATLVDSVNCVWQVPFCEFSTYKATAASAGSTTTGGGGGGGGGGAVYKTYVVNAGQLSSGYSRELNINDSLKLNIEDEEHFVKVLTISGSSARIRVSSEPVEVTMSAGDERMFELTGDDYYDISIKLESISATNVSVLVKSIREAVPAGAGSVGGSDGEIDEDKQDDGAVGEEVEGSSGSLVWLWVLIGLLVIGVVGWFIYQRRK